MGLDGIRTELERIDGRILEYSVDKDLSIEELEEMLESLYRIKEQLLNVSFLGMDIKELEGVRFNLLESIYSTKIWIKEKYGMDVVEELEVLRRLEMEGGKLYEQR